MTENLHTAVVAGAIVLLSAGAPVLGLIGWLDWVLVVAVSLLALELLRSVVQRVLEPWYLGWRSTGIERGQAMPGDDQIPNSRSVTRAISIKAPADEVWPWLAHQVSLELPQMGFRVTSIEPSRSIVNLMNDDSASWTLAIYPAKGRGTRLVSRWQRRQSNLPPLSVFLGALSEPGAFMTEQKLLRSVRDKTESGDTVPTTSNGIQ